MLGALVEGHDDVGAEGDLDFHGAFGGKEVGRAVEVRPEGYAIFGEFAQVAEREDLEAAGIGEHRAGPGHEPVQSAKFADLLVPRPEIKMIGVAEDDLRAEFLENILRNGLNGSDGADRHEDGSFHDAVREFHAPGARESVLGFDLEFQGHSGDCSESFSNSGLEAGFCDVEFGGGGEKYSNEDSAHVSPSLVRDCLAVAEPGEHSPANFNVGEHDRALCRMRCDVKGGGQVLLRLRLQAAACGRAMPDGAEADLLASTGVHRQGSPEAHQRHGAAQNRAR